MANFYTLDVESEKGILPAPVPLDNYLADLNSGQAWYRPSYVMLAILGDERAAALVQGALNRLYLQFWRHQLEYRHSTMNCASISVDTLRALGWELPPRGPSDPLRAWLSVPVKVFAEGRIAAARTAFEYLSEDRTRLMPSAAFEEAVFGLLQLARNGRGTARRRAREDAGRGPRGDRGRAPAADPVVAPPGHLARGQPARIPRRPAARSGRRAGGARAAAARSRPSCATRTCCRRHRTRPTPQRWCGAQCR